MSYLKINISIEFPMAIDTVPQSNTMSSEAPARLGSYLIEAGLITPAQVAVVLNDQNFSQSMRFGEVLVARGWIKPETVEFVMKRVVEPERRAQIDRQNANTRKPSPAQTQPPRTPSRATRPPIAHPPVPPPIAPPMPTTPPIARAKSIDGDFEFEILDDITVSPQDSNLDTGVRNDRKPLSSIPDGGGVNWAG